MLLSNGKATAETNVFEAENGILLGNAVVETENGISFVQGLIDEQDGVRIPVTVSESGFYDVVVTLCSMDGSYKENYLLFDDESMGTIIIEGKEYQDSAVERIYMEKGDHTITITKYWGWVRLDKVTLVPSQELPQDLFDVEPKLINPKATDNAKRLMTYLCDSYGKAVLSGHVCDDGMYGLENACIWRTTGGKYPAILGLDLIEYSPSRIANGSSGKAVDLAIDYWNNGGIVTLCWHWNAPSKYLTGTWYFGFYEEHTNIDLEKIMKGEDEEGYALLLSDIDEIAIQLQRLQDAGVPILWRPLHEASGGWFWWGDAGAQAYIKLYQLMYERLTNVHGLNNLIWIWNGQHADWYPGDEYADIIGEDIYPGERVYTSQADRFMKASRYSQERKLIVLSENGCMFDPDLALRDGAIWGYFCTWGGEFVLKAKGFNKLSEQYTEEAMIQKVYNHELVITRDELPKIAEYPLREEP